MDYPFYLWRMHTIDPVELAQVAEYAKARTDYVPGEGFSSFQEVTQCDATLDLSAWVERLIGAPPLTIWINKLAPGARVYEHSDVYPGTNGRGRLSIMHRLHIPLTDAGAIYTHRRSLDSKTLDVSQINPGHVWLYNNHVHHAIRNGDAERYSLVMRVLDNPDFDLLTRWTQQFGMPSDQYEGRTCNGPSGKAYTSNYKDILVKKILVLGASEAARSIVAYWHKRAEVEVRGRATAVKFDVMDPATWPSGGELSSFDEVHYTSHVQNGTEQIPLVAEFLRRCATHTNRLVVYTSMWGSTTLTEGSRWQWLPYKLVKNAINMVCKVLAHQQETKAQILLLHPGSYHSRMNPNEEKDARDTMFTALKNVEAWDGKFMYMDGRNGEHIPF